MEKVAWIYDSSNKEDAKKTTEECLHEGYAKYLTVNDFINLPESFAVRKSTNFIFEENENFSSTLTSKINETNNGKLLSGTRRSFVPMSKLLARNILGEEGWDEFEQKIKGMGEGYANYLDGNTNNVKSQMSVVRVFWSELVKNLPDDIDKDEFVNMKISANVSNVENESESCMDDKKVNVPVNVIFEGVAGCGKTYSINKLAEEFSGYELVVFHPSSSYEDFVSGLRPEGDTFVGKAGIFVQMCNKAAQDPAGKYLLFIDEINRANTSKVFGDLLMVMEDSKRTQASELPERAVLKYEETKNLNPGHFVRLQTPVKLKLNEGNKSWEYHKDGELFEYLAVPDNLYIVGTMNSTDRSVGTIDLALRRRFVWQTMEPKTAEKISGDGKVNEKIRLDKNLIKWYSDANKFLNDDVSPDARLGHSYFFGQNKTVEQVAHDLLKQLAEIIYIFRIDENLVNEKIGPVAGKKIDFVGQGLGRRPIVVDTEGSETNSGQDND